MFSVIKRETILIVLFLVTSSLVMLAVFYYHYYSKLSEIENMNLEEISKEYSIVIQNYENMAKFLYAHVDGRDDIKKIFYESSLEKNAERIKSFEDKFRDLIEPFYNEIKRYGFSDIQLNFKNSSAFLSMKNDKESNFEVNKSRQTIINSNKHTKYTSGLEYSDNEFSYRFVFPVFYRDEHIGSIEFSVTLSMISSSLESLFGNRYQVILSGKKHGGPIPNLDIYKWCENERFYVTGHRDKEIERVILASDQKNVIFDKLSQCRSFNNRVVNTDKEYLAGFYSLVAYEGKKIGYLVRLNENRLISDAQYTYKLNSIINVLISIILIVFILSYNRIQGRIKEVKMFDAMVVTANHQIKQPLSIISSYLEIMIHDESLDENSKIKLKKIWANADKINHILEKLKQIDDPSYVDYANFTKMIDIDKRSKN
ncbi:MAG: hypothetical protein JXR69_09595 [Candidatus Delongbacteria bacterium]|nr:hypothetical protein [Candidatus Delongbacteria bacterium]